MGYFPILIRVKSTGEYIVCKMPTDIPSGVEFNVIECNIKILG